MLKEKYILDACCGGRMMWQNKNHPNALYMDIRKEEKGIIPTHKNFQVMPDIIQDFRSMTAFEDKRFKLVVWDPPHIRRLGKTSWLAKKYGILDPKEWKEDLKKGFSECWRVLDDYGVLIFKWSEEDTTANEVLKLFHEKPLFGNLTAKKNITMWFTFMKIPKVKS